MKIALCLSGQMRTYKEVYDDLEETILSPLDPDVFIHTWANSGIATRAASGAKDNFTEEAVQYSTLEEMYEPEEAVIEVFKKDYFREKGDVRVPDKLAKATPHYKGNIPMFYKIKKCNDLKSRHEEEKDFRYDLVIRLRPDLDIKEPIPQKVLKNPDTLWFSDYAVDTDFQISDKFAVSNSASMDYYSSVWGKLSEYWENPLGDGEKENYRVGERLMYHHMKESDIPHKPMDVNCFILRQPEANPLPRRIKVAVFQIIKTIRNKFRRM